jgi:hypothetical protein
MDAKERTIVSSFMWVWWENRNKANAKERMMSMEEIIHKTKDAALGAAHLAKPPSGQEAQNR